MPRECVWFTLRSAASWTGVSIGFGRSIVVLKVFCREVTKSGHFQGLAALLSAGTGQASTNRAVLPACAWDMPRGHVCFGFSQMGPTD